jgi:hypothetical protein
MWARLRTILHKSVLLIRIGCSSVRSYSSGETDSRNKRRVHDLCDRMR